jgi:phosphate starvation-inducible protein PhoH
MNIRNDKDFNLKNNKDRDRLYSGFTDEQKTLFHSIQDNVFTFCESNAGTGKTLVSVASMLDMLANDQINRIVYIQKVSQRYLQNGYRPGTIEQKTDGLWQPFYDAMISLGYSPETVDLMISNGLIMLTTDSDLRGVNFEKVGLIVDEAENCDHETLCLIFTRCHDNCHIAMIGDSKQKDNKGKGRNTEFVAYGNYPTEPSFGNKCQLTKNFRGKFSSYAENFVVQ